MIKALIQTMGTYVLYPFLSTTVSSRFVTLPGKHAERPKTSNDSDKTKPLIQWSQMRKREVGGDMPERTHVKHRGLVTYL